MKESDIKLGMGRRRFGQIATANSDAGANAYLQVAVDQAWRAVNDLVRS